MTPSAERMRLCRQRKKQGTIPVRLEVSLRSFAVLDSGLAENGWVTVNPRTLSIARSSCIDAWNALT